MKKNISVGTTGQALGQKAKHVMNVIISDFIFLITIMFYHPKVVMKIPAKIGDKIVAAQTIFTALYGNPWFPSPPVTPTDMQAAITKYEKATVASELGGPDVKAKLMEAWEELNVLLQLLRNHVEDICLVNPSKALEIAQSAGMDLRKATPKGKHSFTVKLNGYDVLLTGRVQAKRCFHEWQCTQDPMAPMSWIIKHIDSTLQAKTTVKGFESGSLWYFRHRCVIKDGPLDWDPVISVRIP
jgi:hypothetical protein